MRIMWLLLNSEYEVSPDSILPFGGRLTYRQRFPLNGFPRYPLLGNAFNTLPVWRGTLSYTRCGDEVEKAGSNCAPSSPQQYPFQWCLTKLQLMNLNYEFNVNGLKFPRSHARRMVHWNFSFIQGKLPIMTGKDQLMNSSTKFTSPASIPKV